MNEPLWPITPSHRSKVIKCLFEVLDDPEADTREILVACKLLIECERQNQSDKQRRLIDFR